MDRKKVHSMIDEIMDGVVKAADSLESTLSEVMESTDKFVSKSTINKYQLGQEVVFDGAPNVVIGMFMTRTNKILYNLTDDYDETSSNIEEALLSV